VFPVRYGQTYRSYLHNKEFCAVLQSLCHLQAVSLRLAVLLQDVTSEFPLKVTRTPRAVFFRVAVSSRLQETLVSFFHLFSPVITLNSRYHGDEVTSP
jgi:hypothetical protein